ncbi:MAG: carbohydrate ABC transporter permease [Acidimicrobiales bacterium]
MTLWTRAPASTSRRRRFSGKEALIAYACLLPSIVVFTVFAYYPLYALVQEALRQSNSFGTASRYVGFSQFSSVLSSGEFLSGLAHSALYVVFTVPVGLIAGTVLAVSAHRRLRGIKIFQTIFTSTVATSTAVSSVIFFVLINPEVGIFRTNILNDPRWALLGVSFSSMWANLGLCFIIVLAGLQAVPDELIEAATLDGFGAFRRFLRVTLPLLSPVYLFLIVVLSVFGFQAYAQIVVLTQGGPAGATQTLVYDIFNSQTPNLQGVGAVMSLGLLVVTAMAAAVQFSILQRRVQYGTR